MGLERVAALARPRWAVEGADHHPYDPGAQSVRDGIAFTFTGVTPYADAYVSKHTDAPDSLESALRNAPPGSTVDGAVYWDVYRALVTNVVLYNPQTGEHLAQWNIWQPGAPLP